MTSCFRPLQLLAATAIMTFTGCGGSPAPVAEPSSATVEGGKTPPAKSAPLTAVAAHSPQYVPQPTIYANAVAAFERPVIVIRTSAGDITIELDIEHSPQTVLNFLDKYARDGFYDQTIFHYADPDSFVAAGGFTEDLALKTTSSPIYNESNNGLSNVRGTVAMSRDADSAHSATSQFFINVVDNPGLDFQETESDAQRGYCVFGQVVEGMEIVDQIAHSQVQQEGDFERLPVTPIMILSVEEVR
jgi:cyclophilin family peptidyl-prolyl cis-trans isomerase